jgi:hypothetical protein
VSIEDKLRDFARAYPEDVFTPITASERKAYPTIITKASADMGRHFAPFAIEAADRIRALEAALNGVIAHCEWVAMKTGDLVLIDRLARSALKELTTPDGEAKS